MDKLIKEIIESVSSLNKVQEQHLSELEQKINYIIKNNIKDEFIIEHTFDKLLDLTYWFGKRVEELYYKLINYYIKINPDVTKDYEEFYLSIIEGESNMYQVGMLCKHFKGKTLLEKNIYRIEEIGVNGTDIDESTITYTGEGELSTATNLVVYSNIFQENKLFAREYNDISSELTEEKQEEFNQTIRVQPLTEEEISIINSPEFIAEKKQYVLTKFKK